MSAHIQSFLLGRPVETEWLPRRYTKPILGLGTEEFHAIEAFLSAHQLHRRYFVDDDLGVEEALDDRGAGGEGVVVKGKHFVHLGTPREALLFMRRAALQQVYQPVVLFAHTPFAPIPKKRVRR